MIKRIEALGYRCFRYIEQEIEPFQILVGPNASGKSTFIDIISFISDLMNKGLEEAVRSRAPDYRDLFWMKKGSRFELAVEVIIPKEILTIREEREFEICRYEIAIGEKENGELAILSEELWRILDPCGLKR